MASPAPVDVGDALEELVNQFADPMSFFRELIQNSLDAGSSEVEIEFEFEASEGNREQGAMTIIVTDWGEGMDREIIDAKLTRLFSSSKDGDMTKIGKFGIGFVSVFAIKPDAVCVDTGRSGERWRVLFGADRSFKRLRLDEAIEGTTIRIIKTTTRSEYEAFVARAREVVAYWCRHALGEVRIAGETISEPFGLEAPLKISYRDELSEIHLGHRDGSTLHGFYNGGLTLIEGDHAHPSSVPEFHGLAFKVSSRYLEHTLSRDDVIKEENFHKVIGKIRELVVGRLREEVLSKLDSALRAEPGSAEALRDDELAFLYRAVHWHLRHALAHGKAQLDRKLRRLAAVRSVGGRIWTWAELPDALDDTGAQLFARVKSPLSDALEREGLVILRVLGQTGDASDDLLGPTNLALAEVIGCYHPPMEDKYEWVERCWALPLAPSPEERQRWQPLARALGQVLDEGGYKVSTVEFGRFEGSGSQLDGRAAISMRELDEPVRLAEATELPTGLLARRRRLVVDADHPTVRTLIGLATREPELAAYQLAKLFLLRIGAIEQARDTELCSAAMRIREERCPRPQN